MNEHDREIFLLHTCAALSTQEIRHLLEGCARTGVTPSSLHTERCIAFGLSPQKSDFVVQHIHTFSIDSVLRELHKANVRPISLSDPEYPSLLKETYDPPFFLFARGHVRTDIPFVAVVGTRHPTPYGISVTKTMTSALVLSGFGIVSGLAHGVDSIAHQEALRTGGYTVAVLAHGHSRSTPREHTLAEHIIASGGGIISEHLPHTHAQKHFFPIRNRIIAGMARATLITEATLKSGTLITASSAIRENRDVLAIPGLITNPHAEGPHKLISEGAACIHSPTALREALHVEATPTQSTIPLPSQETSLLFQYISGGPKHIDDLLEYTQKPLREIINSLNILKSQKLIEERPGNTYASINLP